MRAPFRCSTVTWAADNCIGGDESSNFGASLLWGAESLTGFDHLVWSSRSILCRAASLSGVAAPKQHGYGRPRYDSSPIRRRLICSTTSSNACGRTDSVLFWRSPAGSGWLLAKDEDVRPRASH